MAKNPSRRSVLKRGLGGVSVLVAGGLVWRAWDNGVFSTGEGPAYEPWADWESGVFEPPLSFIQSAILAANAHNTQPWLFKATEDRVEIYADLSRNLGAFDAFRREMFISLGCALENLHLGVREVWPGSRITLAPGTLPPDPDNGMTLAATITRSGIPTDGPSALFAQIPLRHTNRGTYHTDRQIDADTQAQLATAAGGNVRIAFFSGAKRDALGALIVNATEQIVRDHEMSGDSAKWFRFKWDELQKHRDGVSLDTVGLPPLINAAAKIIPAPSVESSDQQWLASTRDVHVGTAPLLGIISVRNLYGREDSLKAGRAWQKMHLLATAAGVALHPLNQPVEIVDREAQLGQPAKMADALADLSGSSEWRPTFTFRAGYPERPARLSPRRALEDVLVG